MRIFICCFSRIKQFVLSQLRYNFWIFKYCRNLVEFLGRISGLRKDPDYAWKHWQYKMWRCSHTCLGSEPTISVFERSKSIYRQKTSLCDSHTFSDINETCACLWHDRNHRSIYSALFSFSWKVLQRNENWTGYNDPSSAKNCLVKKGL